MTTIQFEKSPSVVPSFMRALFLPRKGLDRDNPKLPDLNASLSGLSIDPNNLRSFGEICQLKNDALSLVYPHALASSIHMVLLTHKTFPIRLLGAVHLRNQITQHANIAVDDVLRIKTGFTEVRITGKGVEFDFTTKVFKNDNPVWEELTTYFKRGRFGKATHEPIATLESLNDKKEIATWHLGPKLGKRYAKICNDYNPIHTSKHLAKLFGFKRDVAHGMGVLATAIDRTNIESPSTNDVFFKGPLFLDSDVKLFQGITETGRFDVYCGGNSRPSICFKLG